MKVGTEARTPVEMVWRSGSNGLGSAGCHYECMSQLFVGRRNSIRNDAQVVNSIAEDTFAIGFKPRVAGTVSVHALQGDAIRMAYRFFGEENLGLIVLVRCFAAGAKENQNSPNPQAMSNSLHTSRKCHINSHLLFPESKRTLSLYFTQ